MEALGLQKIKEIIEELLQKMTMPVLGVEILHSYVKTGPKEDVREVIEAQITLPDPQMLIGQQGQTLAELERLIRIIVNKQLRILRIGETPSGDDRGNQDFYITLDINGYKAKKVEYLKNLANAAADEVLATRQEKVLPPMPSFERRIVHMELSLRPEVVAISQGNGTERRVIVTAR